MSKENESAPLNREDIVEILRVFDESDFHELNLEVGALKLVVRKGRSRRCLEQSEEGETGAGKATPNVETEAPTTDEGNTKASASANRVTRDMEPEETANVLEEAHVEIRAPSLGIFYRSPAPGFPPFVNVGTYVTEDDTVCMIEVMKNFTAVKAGMNGRIARICVENAQMVEYNQTLFLVQLDACREKGIPA